MVTRRKHKRLEKQKQTEIDITIAKLLTQIGGKYFLWWLLEQCHVLQNSFDADSERATAFRLGEQNIGLQVLSAIERVDPQAWLRLREEQLNFLSQFDEVKNEEDF